MISGGMRLHCNLNLKITKNPKEFINKMDYN
jgi:hypothetical protein